MRWNVLGQHLALRQEFPTKRDLISRSIASEGYKLIKGVRFAFGHGIYSTPDIEVALLYAQTFTIEGVSYKAIIQNRVNPKTVVKVSKKETGVGEYWISPKNEDIRPYGFCVRKA